MGEVEEAYIKATRQVLDDITLFKLFTRPDMTISLISSRETLLKNEKVAGIQIPQIPRMAARAALPRTPANPLSSVSASMRWSSFRRFGFFRQPQSENQGDSGI